MLRGPQSNIHDPLLVVGSSYEQHREFPVGFRPVDIRTQRHAIAHLGLDVSLHRHFVFLAVRAAYRQEQRRNHSKKESNQNCLRCFS